ncbi:MAG: PA4642 family protein [Ketobacteraceae bacterium]|nr:PA4642 family protein [Ketobacteraceae bacterium]
MLKKDKQKVIGETLDEAKVRAFLEYQPYESEENADFHILTKAYRGLPAHEFERFLEYYREAGRELNPVNSEGERFIDMISRHENQQEYVEILKNAGA